MPVAKLSTLLFPKQLCIHCAFVHSALSTADVLLCDLSHLQGPPPSATLSVNPDLTSKTPVTCFVFNHLPKSGGVCQWYIKSFFTLVFIQLLTYLGIRRNWSIYLMISHRTRLGNKKTSIFLKLTDRQMLNK